MENLEKIKKSQIKKLNKLWSNFVNSEKLVDFTINNLSSLQINELLENSKKKSNEKN